MQSELGKIWVSKHSEDICALRKRIANTAVLIGASVLTTDSSAQRALSRQAADVLNGVDGFLIQFEASMWRTQTDKT